MRGKDLLEDLQYLREEYIEEAGKIRKISGLPGAGGFRYRHMAACLLVFCLAGGVAAAVGYVNKGGLEANPADGLSGMAQTKEGSTLIGSGADSGVSGWDAAAIEQEEAAAGDAQTPLGRMSQQESESQTGADVMQQDIVSEEEKESGIMEADSGGKGESGSGESGSTETEGQEIQQLQAQESVPVAISAGESAQKPVVVNDQGQALSGYKILESPEDGGGEHPVTVCYKSPDIGTYFYSVSVKSALEEHQGEKILYHLRLEVFADLGDNESEIIDLSSGEKEQKDLLEAECKRLQNAGYNVELGDSFIKGYFSAEDLEDFEPLAKYGYFFCFENEW